jgi:hypothetical protein
VTETNAPPDLRPLLFTGAAWYEGLEEPARGRPSAWYLAKAPLEAARIHAQVLSRAAAFLVEHDLVEAYRRRFAGIRPVDIAEAHARAESQSVTTPVLVIANEFIVARYLERVLGWQYIEHEPAGRSTHRGEWLFRMPGGRDVFVEVKTFAEPAPEPSGGAYMRPDYRPKVRSVLKGAYRQLPEDERASLVVLVGDEITEISHGIVHGDVFQALFGQYQIRFTPFADDLNLRGGPSFRDMFTHGTKHRLLGCVAALEIATRLSDAGRFSPALHFYAIDNPFAHDGKRLTAADLAAARRFMVNEEGLGSEIAGHAMEDAWRLFRDQA